jgi:L-galactono-1,4-lactone dehydrogenase
VRRRMASRYPVDQFNAMRRRLDPKNIMSNRIVDALFPLDAQLA